MDDTRAKSLEEWALHNFSQRPQEFLFWSVLSKNWNLVFVFWILFLYSRNLPSKILKRFYKTISPLPKLGAGSVFTLCLLSSVNLKIIKLLLSVQKKMSNCASWIISTIEFQKHLPCKVHCFHAIKHRHCHFSMWNHWSWRNCRMRTPNV